jgi:hypothetical protein
VTAKVEFKPLARQVIARDEQGRIKVIAPSTPRMSGGLTWWSRGDLMAFDGEDTVERWRATPEGFSRVEVWRLGGG